MASQMCLLSLSNKLAFYAYLDFFLPSTFVSACYAFVTPLGSQSVEHYHNRANRAIVITQVKAKARKCENEPHKR